MPLVLPSITPLPNLARCGSDTTTAALRAPRFHGAQKVANRLIARFGAEIALAVHANADGIGFHVALPDDQHGVDFHLFDALDFTVDLSPNIRL